MGLCEHFGFAYGVYGRTPGMLATSSAKPAAVLGMTTMQDEMRCMPTCPSSAPAQLLGRRDLLDAGIVAGNCASAQPQGRPHGGWH